MVLRTKPEANQWLHLTPRVAALGADAFEQGPVMINKIHAYLLKEVNLAENAGEKTAEFVNRVCQVTLETFWTEKAKGEEGSKRTDSMLEGLGAGWIASFLAKVYPKLSRYLIKEFLQAVVEVSIVELLALFMMFGAESFVKGPVILLTEGIQNLRLDGILTLIAINYGNLGELMKLTRYPEQMIENVKKFDVKKATDSWKKIRDLRNTLIQYLLQQNRFGTGEKKLPKSGDYCGPIRRKSYSYMSGVIGIAYNPFLSEDIRDCFFGYKQAVLLRFWTSRIATIESATNPQTKLGLVWEEKVTAPSVPKSDKRVEFGLGFSDELLRTSLMVVWELMRPSWCPSPNADSILRATQDVQRELNADCNLRDLNIIYHVMTTASRSNGEDKVELSGWGPEDWVKPVSCLAEVCGLEGHVCRSLDCVKIQERQHKQLTILLGNVMMKARTETELIVDCHGGTEVNLVIALGFCSMFGSLESLLNLEQKHEIFTAISVEVFPGVLQTEKKYIGKWREAIKTEMNIRHSEIYR